MSTRENRRRFLMATVGIGTVALTGLGTKVSRASTSTANCEVSVMDYGTDTAAFQAAVDNHESVFVPAGSYYVSGLHLNSKTRLYGSGTLITTDTSTNQIAVFAAGCEIVGLTLVNEGGTGTRITNWPDRPALVKVTADDCVIRDCTLKDGPQNFIDFYSVNGGVAENNEIIGGINSFSHSNNDSLYQGIRVTNSSSIFIFGNRFWISDNGGMTGEAICLATNTSGIDRCTISNNFVERALDHGVYAIGIKNSTISNNVITADGSAIVCTSVHPGIVGVFPNSVTDNVCVAGHPSSSGVPGIYLRDSNFVNADGNIIEYYSTGIQVSPVQYEGPTCHIDRNRITNNIIRGWRRNGIVLGKAGKQLGSFSDNVISGNLVSWDDTSANLYGASISMNIGNESGTRIAKRNVIENNVFQGAPDAGVSASGHDDLLIKGNSITNPSCSGGGSQRAGIAIYDCYRIRILDNHILQLLSGDMRGGVVASPARGVTNGEVRGNTIIGTSKNYAPIRRMQYASDQNHLEANRTGEDPLDGVVTLTNSLGATVYNDNINYARGYTSYVQLIPLNTTASSLVTRGAPYVDPINHSENTSFMILIGNGETAHGSEKFMYRIIQ